MTFTSRGTKLLQAVTKGNPQIVGIPFPAVRPSWAGTGMVVFYFWR